MRSKAGWLALIFVAILLIGIHLGVGGSWLRQRLLRLHGMGHRAASGPASLPLGKAAETTIPFALVRRHVMVECSVNKSRPLWFILDTGDRYAIIDVELARELGLKVGDGHVAVVGTGAKAGTGAVVDDASFTLAGFPGFAQPVTLAIPLRQLGLRLGHRVDGILGSELIEQYVVEIDYQARRLKFHDPSAFVYQGAGESIPIQLSSMGHPILEAVVTPVGGAPLRGRFALDIGASGALTLHRPFNEEHNLPGTTVKSIKALGGSGIGGEHTGRLARVAKLQVGRFEVSRPVTYFSQDEAGVYASSDIQGELGEEIASRFKLFLDYGHNRIIFEPIAPVGAAAEPAMSGLAIMAEGSDYRTFRIHEVLASSPAADAGLQVDDIILEVDSAAAATLSLDTLLARLEGPTPCQLTVQRGATVLQVTVTPRALV
jgi:hypothetical protein